VVSNDTQQKSVNSHRTGEVCQYLLGRAVRIEIVMGTWIAYVEKNHESHNCILDTINFHEPEEDMPPPTARERVDVL
jgi:hypothetical protein